MSLSDNFPFSNNTSHNITSQGKVSPKYTRQLLSDSYYNTNNSSSYYNTDNSAEILNNDEAARIFEIDDAFSEQNPFIYENSSVNYNKNILSSDADFSMMITSMQPDDIENGNYDLDEIFQDYSSSDSGFDNMIASVANSMSISGTLDFIENAFTPASQYNGVSIPVTTMGKFKGISGNATLPILGIITSKFGFRPKYGRMHKGVDIALSVGDTVKCAIEGTVSRVDWDQKGYGLFIVVKHANDIETRYAHLNSALVGPGELVLAGTPIALGGNTGNSTGPHLHFETRYQGQALDPTMLFDFSTGNVNSKSFMASNSNSMDDDAMQAAYSLQGRSTYVVKLGDTLTGIARKARISLHTLCRLNGLNSNSLPEPGRMLRLR